MNEIHLGAIIVGIWIIVGVLLVVFIRTRGEPTGSDDMALVHRDKVDRESKFKE
jgi:ABC-type thiamin/hydroxymethylpyrimidine transport system permease subunit